MSGQTPQLDLLLVPASGPTGTGEAQAALLLARNLLRRRPQSRVCVALSATSPLASQNEVQSLLLPDSPTRCNAPMVEFIRAHRPRVVVFDSSCRRRQQAAAVAAGARCIFVCWRSKSRRRALAISKLFRWSEVWLQSPPAAEAPLSRWERVKLAMPGAPKLSTIGPIADPSDLNGANKLLPAGWTNRPFVLLCPGGSYGVELFRELADRLRAQGKYVVLSCSAPPRGKADPALLELPRLPNAVLLGLVQASDQCVLNGGGLLLQSIALGKRPLAVPMARDQSARIRRLAALELCDAAQSLDPTSLAWQVLELPSANSAAQSARARTYQLNDGLTTATSRLQSILDAQNLADTLNARTKKERDPCESR